MLGIVFVLGLFTGWKLTSSQRAEEPMPSTYKREVPSPKTTAPSTPIFIIPHRPTSTPPAPTKPKAAKPQSQQEISITPSNVVSPPQAVTTPPPQETRPKETPSEEGKLFRVTIGPLDEEEAKKQQENFAKEGKQAFLVPANGKYKLQLGAFIHKENAQQLADELRRAGYNPSVEER